MKKLTKMKLRDVVVLEKQEMKLITGGGNGCWVETSCGSGTYTVDPSYFDYSSEWYAYLRDLQDAYCGESGPLSYQC